MNTAFTRYLLGLTVSCLLATHAAAQSTTFTYQGRLASAGTPVSTPRDFRFRLFDAATGGDQVGTDQSRPNTPVTSGVFHVQLDFGAAAFPGADRWLEVAVSAVGANAWHTIAPRVFITSAPYAIRASTAGTSATVAANGVGTGALMLNAVNSARIQDGTIAPADLGPTLLNSTFWRLDGNPGTSPANNFLGTTDNQPLAVRANNAEVMRILANGNVGIGTALPGKKLQVGDIGTASEGMIRLTSREGGANRTWDIGVPKADETKTGYSFVVDDPATGTGPELMIKWGTGRVGIGTSSPEDALLDLEGDLRVNNHELFLRSGSDRSHGIGYRETAAGQGINGPFVYGWDGGALGVSGPDSISLSWDYLGNVEVSQHLSSGSLGVQTDAVVAGKLGVRTTTPKQALHVNGDYYGRGHLWLHANEGDGHSGTAYVQARDDSGSTDISMVLRTQSGGTVRDAIYLDAAGNTTVNVLTIRGGADLAEPFPMSGDNLPKGSLVVIDTENPGKLKLSKHAYDTRVAGIVSGANGLNAGITLHQEGLLGGGQNVALSGRVYALADASYGPIMPGDLLTSSATAGHVMKVTEHAKAQGATVGKAMTPLAQGRGLVLILVTLQ